MFVSNLEHDELERFCSSVEVMPQYFLGGTEEAAIRNLTTIVVPRLGFEPRPPKYSFISLPPDQPAR
jgi:hypothetical protein